MQLTLMRTAALPSLFLLFSGLSLSQVDTGSILGSIKDTSGAFIPGARVTLTNEDTALAETTTSGASGEYTFSPVKIGHYAVSAEFKGFQRVEHTQVTVDVQQRVVVDLTLPPGQMTANSDGHRVNRRRCKRKTHLSDRSSARARSITCR